MENNANVNKAEAVKRQLAACPFRYLRVNAEVIAANKTEQQELGTAQRVDPQGALSSKPVGANLDPSEES